MPIKEPVRKAGSKHCGNGHLKNSARHRNTFDRPKIFERKVKADAEHQQHHTDFRELRGERSIRNDAGRVLARRNAREQITHESW